MDDEWFAFAQKQKAELVLAPGCKHQLLGAAGCPSPSHH